MRAEIDHKLCFVLMPMRGEFEELYEYIIKPTVEEVDLNCEYAGEIVVPGLIMDDIWDRIERARVLVADLTECNPNVVYEVGYAHSLDKRKVILLSQSLDGLPFDLRGFRCIPYGLGPRALEKLRAELHVALRAVLGQLTPDTRADGRDGEIRHSLDSRRLFVGRGTEIANVLGLLRTGRPNIVVINGFAGVGKSSLALEVAWACVEKARRGALTGGHSLMPAFRAVIWIDAGPGRKLVFDEMLDAIVRQMGYREVSQKPPEAKRRQVEALLRMEPVLIVIDNLDDDSDATITEFLTKVPEPSSVMITTRKRMSIQAHSVILRGLRPLEGRRLLRKLGRADGPDALLEADNSLLDALCTATEALPLALHLSVGRIRDGESLEAVLEGFSQARGPVFEHLFARSWASLSETSKRVLMAMMVFASSASREAIAAVASLDGSVLDEAIQQLFRLWLLEHRGGIRKSDIRYGVHPLTRAFARRRARGEYPGFERRARSNAAAYFLSYGSACGGLCEWRDYNWRVFDAMERDFSNILAVVDWAAEAQQHQVLVDYASLLMHFLHFKGHWHERMRLGELALAAARELGDRRTEAWVLVDMLSWIDLERGDLRKAAEAVAHGKAIADELGESDCVAVAEGHLARISRLRDAHDKAREHLVRGLAIVRTPRVLARLRYELGLVAYAQANLDEAHEQCEQALSISEQIDDASGKIRVHLVLGDLSLARARSEDAEAHYVEALSEAKAAGRLSSIGTSLIRIAGIEERKGNYDRALSLAKDAREIFAALGMKPDVGNASKTVERLTGQAQQDGHGLSGRLDDRFGDQGSLQEWVGGKTRMKLILFDIDGTLLESTDVTHVESYTHAVESVFGVEAHLYDTVPDGETDSQIFVDILGCRGIAATAVRQRLADLFLARYAYLLENPTRSGGGCALPGVRSLLTKLHGRFLLGLVTGNER